MPSQPKLGSPSPKSRDIVPVARPHLPTVDKLTRYLKMVDSNRWYSNRGPLSKTLETRLVQHFGGETELSAITSSSGTTGLWAALVALCNRSGGFCLMPSWTFGATAAAALHAGLTPYFLDVEEETWALDPEHTIERALELQAAAIVPVIPFGVTFDLKVWADVARETGAKVVVDAAAAFDTLSASHLSGDPPVMVSLHATKVLPAGEGGVLFTNDPELGTAVRRLLNFGFSGDRVAREPGFNGKMSEYHAAVAQASLDAWRETRESWITAKDNLRRALGSLQGIIYGPDAAGLYASSTFNIGVSDARALAQRLAEKGVGSIRWWGDGCRAQPAYARFPSDPLPVTKELARHTLGLPLWRDMSAADAEIVTAAMRK